MTKIKLVIASNNQHKIEEIREIIGNTYELLSLDDIGFHEDIPETGVTFEENALIKARTIYNKFGLNCFADDSGLEVKALNNEPGVYSARYAGEPVDHQKNIDKLLNNLENIEDRSARFVTVIALILNGEERLFEGEIKGSIRNERSGNNGFGYDPVFQPEGHPKTFAELDAEMKNSISHRGRALQKMLAEIP